MAAHDSYIVLEEHADDLRNVMGEAWRKPSVLSNNKLLEDVFEANIPTSVKTKEIGYFVEEIDNEEEGGGEEHKDFVKMKLKNL